MDPAVHAREHVERGSLRSLGVLAAVVALVAVPGRREQPQVAPAALARDGADALDRRLRHDHHVDALPGVRHRAVEAIEDAGAHRAGPGHRRAVHVAEDDEARVAREKLRHLHAAPRSRRHRGRRRLPRTRSPRERALPGEAFFAVPRPIPFSCGAPSRPSAIRFAPRGRLCSRRETLLVQRARRGLEFRCGFAFGFPGHVGFSLFRALVEIRRGPAASGHVRIGVDELLRGELVDRARLRLALPVREGAGDDPVGDRLPRLVHRVSAEHRETPAHDRPVLLGRAGQAIVGSDPRHIANVDLRKAAVGSENEQALRRLAERIGFLAVRRRDLGDHEIPSADELGFEGLRLLRRGAARQDECKRGERDLNELH